MPYIGPPAPDRFVAPKAATQFSGDGSTTAFTLDHAVGSDEDILVSVDGVIQEPSVAYAVSNGTTLTFTGAPSSNSGNNIFVYYLFRTVGTVSHPSNNALSASDITVDTTTLVTDSTNNRVGIGIASPDGTLHVHSASAGSVTADSEGDELVVENNGNGGISILTPDTARSALFLGHASDNLKVQLRHDGNTSLGSFISDSTLTFHVGDGTERMRIDTSGRLFVGTTTTTLTDTAGLTVQLGGTGNTIGLTTVSQLGGVAFIANRNSDDGTVIQIRQANATEGTISVSGSTVSYSAFSGSHWSRLTDNSKPTILKGTVIETIDEMCDWYRVKFTVAKTEEKEEYVESISIALPSGKKEGDTISYTHEGITYDDAVLVKENDNKHTKCKISETADSKRVYGVFADWDNDDDTVNDMYVTAVGTHVVRINKDVTVQAGDLLSSNGDGTAKVQDDDIIRSKTIGKVLTNIKQETYSDGSYTVPCALYCG